MKKFKIGLQLYSIREDVEKDMDAALKAVKEMGYDCVEFAGFFGKSAEEVRAMLDKYGLEAISVHQTAEPWLKEGQKAIDYLKTVGVKFCAIPWYQKEKLYDKKEFAKMIIEFTEFGKALKENGIQLLYHNHDFEFGKKYDGEYVFDCIYNSVPADLLRPEMDVCWIKYGGEDPCKYIEKYDGMKLLHLKDFTAERKWAAALRMLLSMITAAMQKRQQKRITDLSLSRSDTESRILRQSWNRLRNRELNV